MYFPYTFYVDEIYMSHEIPPTDLTKDLVSYPTGVLHTLHQISLHVPTEYINQLICPKVYSVLPHRGTADIAQDQITRHMDEVYMHHQGPSTHVTKDLVSLPTEAL